MREVWRVFMLLAPSVTSIASEVPCCDQRGEAFASQVEPQKCERFTRR